MSAHITARGIPAGYEDSEDSDYEREFNANSLSPLSGSRDGVENHEDKTPFDPWADTATYKDIPIFPKRAKLTLIDFREALEAGNLKTVEEFLAEHPGEEFLEGKVGGLSDVRPVFLACQNGDIELLKFLCGKGASLQPHQSDRATVLMAVCSGGSMSFDRNRGNEENLLRCAEFLAEECQRRGVDLGVNNVQSQNMTCLMFAARCGHLKLVEFLVERGAKLDLADTQRWTALCFAADRGHGHVVRTLLELGADPDVITVEGQTLADLVGQMNAKLLEVVEAAMRVHGGSKISRNMRSVEANVKGYKKFTELENILLGIDASDYLELFETHGLTLDQFLTLNESDLEKIGVKKVGVRKRMVEAICDIHKKDWEKTSLPKITPKDRQKGIYFSCPDGVMMTANVSEHINFLAANANYLAKNVNEHPELLEIGMDVADLDTFIKYVSTCRSRLKTLNNQVRNLERILKRHEGDPRFYPADRIPAKRSRSFKYVWLAAAIVLPIVIFKRFK